MGQKQGFFNLFKNLVINFYRIFSIMKIYSMYCAPAFLFLRCCQPIRFQDFLVGEVKNGCGHSGHETLKLTVSQE